MKVKVLVAQSCPTLYDPMDCTPPNSSVSEIVQRRILEWVAIPFSKGASWPKDGTFSGLPHCRQILYCLSHQGWWLLWKMALSVMQIRRWNVTCFYFIWNFLLLLFVGHAMWHMKSWFTGPGVDPVLPELGTQNLNHCTTREVPNLFFTWWCDALQCLL